jgi:hypothetical protein
MQFYQNGLDWKPNNISKNGSVIKDDMGYWNPENHGKVVEIDSPYITMEGVDQPLLGVSDTGDTKLMQPGEDYKFKGTKVTEYPQAQNGWLGKYDNNTSDATRVAPKMIPLSEEEKRQNLIKQSEQNKRDLDYNQKVIAERKKARDTKGSVAEHNFTTGEKFRAFPNSVGGAGEVFDDYINPAKIIGDRASSLGNSRTPLEALGSVATTAGFGALGFDPLGDVIAAKGLVNPTLESAGKYLTEETALKNTYKLNPYAFKPNPEAFYRQVGKAAYDDAMIEGKVYAKGQKDLLERNPNINYLNEYNASIAAGKAGKFHLTKPENAPFVQKGKLFYPIDRKPTGTGYKLTKFADAEYLFEGTLPNEAILPKYQEKYLSSLNKSRGAGVVRPEFNDLDNFKTYRRDWLKGYKEVPKPTHTEQVISKGVENPTVIRMDDIGYQEPATGELAPYIGREERVLTPAEKVWESFFKDRSTAGPIPKTLGSSKQKSGGWLNKYK